MLVNLLAEMTRFGVTDEQIARAIGRTRRAVKSRLNGEIEISSEDIKKIRDHFFPFYTLDYLLDEEPLIVSSEKYNQRRGA